MIGEDDVVRLVLNHLCRSDDPKPQPDPPLEAEDYLDADALAFLQDVVRGHLSVEVSPGVAIIDAVRAYVALEQMADERSLHLGTQRMSGAWYVQNRFGSRVGATGPTLAAAILAATEAPDA